MDEPTAALSGPRWSACSRVVRALQERGAAVLFISHRLDEVFAICDTVTVMRDGEVMHDAPVGDMTTDEMVRRMVGRELGALFPKQDAQIGERVLEVKRLTREGVFFDVSFEVRARRDRRARRASSAPAAARSRARSSGSTAPTPATSRSPGGGWRRAARSRPCTPASRSCPRTAACRAS